MKLSSYDLNHVRALHVLLEEAHVARAARRLGISAPAASNALRRLRTEFDDELLVRAGRGLVRTALAEALRGPAREVVEAAERLLAVARPFEPRTFQGELLLATSDHVALVLLGPLEALLGARAPLTDVRVHPVPTRLEPWLREGGDLVLGPFEVEGEELCAELLFEDEYLCLMRPGHPLARGRWTAESYARASHVMVSPRGMARGGVDEALGALGLRRRVARTVPTFSAAPGLLTDSEHLATLPASFARTAAAQAGLVLRPPPLALSAVPVRMVWHRRHEADERHRWLRLLVREALQPRRRGR